MTRADSLLHKLRRKSNRSCFLASPSARDRPITALASDGGKRAFRLLACASIASTRSVVRPSCCKKILCPSPHRGAVRNSSDPATPWTMSSASRGPRLNLDFTQELPRKLLPTRAKEGHTYLREKRLFTTRCLWRGGCGVDSRRAHNPKVAGSNPAPATIDDEGLADVSAANPFRLPRLHPGIGRHRTWARDSCCETAVPRSRLQGILQAWTEC